MNSYLFSNCESHSMLFVNVTTFDNVIPIYEHMKMDERSKYKTINLGFFVLFAVITFLGIFFNATVLYIMIRHGEKIVANCFLINLALTDFTFLSITSPVTASFYIRSSWIFGEAFCKLVMYMINVTLHATCLTLMAMTVDRYTSIVHVFRSRRWRTAKFAVKVCVTVWIVSFLLPVPFAIYYREVTNVVTNRHHCLLMWPDPPEVYNKVATIGIACTTYILPLAVITFCYSRILYVIYHRNDPSPSDDSEKRNETSPAIAPRSRPRWRTTKLVILLVVVFSLLWFPVHFLVVWSTLDQDMPKNFTVYVVKGIARCLSYSNSCVNPFLYVFMSKGFRQALKQAFPNCGVLRTLHLTNKTDRQRKHGIQGKQLTSD